MQELTEKRIREIIREEIERDHAESDARSLAFNKRMSDEMNRRKTNSRINAKNK